MFTNFPSEMLFGGANRKNIMIKQYIKSSFQELSKVTWLTKNQAVKLTIIVLVFCLVSAFVLGFVDYLLQAGYTYLITNV